MSTTAIGKKRWAIAEGYIPRESSGTSRDLLSHEAVCILNSGSDLAQVELHVFFAEREPAGPYLFNVAPRRTLHIRINDLNDPEAIPSATEYSMLIESNVPIVVQHTRLDSRQASLALLSTIAYAANE
jgi:hypothetical protein